MKTRRAEQNISLKVKTFSARNAPYYFDAFVLLAVFNCVSQRNVFLRKDLIWWAGDEAVFGDLECFEIKAQAESRIGKTSLTAYFNEEFGFVKLEYTNIDSSRVVMELNKLTNEE